MKYLGIGITLIALIGGIIFGYGKLQEKVAKTEVIVEKHEDKIDEIEKIDIRQSVILERTTKVIERLEQKL